MAQIPGTIPIAGKIAPTDSLDNYPTHDSIYGKGGLTEVANNTARDAISTQRRSEGMLVYVVSSQVTYQLVGGITNLNWQVFAGSTGMAEGAGNPNGIISASYGQKYRDTVTDSLYVNISNPTGTVWIII